MNFNKAVFKCAYGLSKQLPPSDSVEIAFSGRSNVGKSSAINKIFNRKSLARVSGVPGKTSTINFYDVEEINFVDLPGYGYAKVSKSEKHRWSELIEGYFNQDRYVGLVVALVDIRHPASNLDYQMIDYLIEHEMPFIVALTKWDKLNKTQSAERLRLIRSELPCGEDLTILPISSETGAGIPELRLVIQDVVDEYLKQKAEYDQNDLEAEMAHEALGL